ncbi:MAG: radical SAM protein [Woeseiaceae bacterium]
MSSNTQIILSTLNARYIHASLGLRYLLANMGNLRAQTQLLEFIINSRPTDIVEALLKDTPKIIGLGVYIWNAEETLQVVKLLKKISPETVIILGGPEVTYETNQQEITTLADYVITGQADITFSEVCGDILNNKKPLEKIIKAEHFKLDEINLPYAEYTDEDIQNRVIYVEASRGCPFKCEFCLSSLDKTVYPFNLDLFLEQMQTLFERGVRSFKFIDRTFNLKVVTSIKIMKFFLQKMDEDRVYLHFELIPDHLPEKLKAAMQQFPEDSLQFEIGIQSLNPEIQDIISRKQDDEKVHSNMNWIREETSAHIHADLIIGLPGETLESFAKGFNELVAMNPHEIQVGVLKRLRGTPIIRHTQEYDMRYSPTAPYEILSNNIIDFSLMQRLKRFARYWDMIANSGRFKYSKELLLGKTPFENFLALSNWLHTETDQTHKIALPRLFTLLRIAMVELLKLDIEQTESCLLKDFSVSGIKGQPKFLKQQLENKTTSLTRRSESRQKRHKIT